MIECMQKRIRSFTEKLEFLSFLAFIENFYPAGALGIAISFDMAPRRMTGRIHYYFAGPPGLEPGTVVLETTIIPFNYRPL